MGSGHGQPAGDRPPTGGVLNILQQSGLLASTGGVLATISECKMSLYAWFYLLCITHTLVQSCSSNDLNIYNSPGLLASRQFTRLPTLTAVVTVCLLKAGDCLWHE